MSNNNTEPCTLPFIPVGDKDRELSSLELPKGACFSPIIWNSKELKEDSPGVYKSAPPEPHYGFWMGYYLMVEFPGDTSGGTKIFENKFVFTTPGWTWPNTLPYPDCQADGCVNRIV